MQRDERLVTARLCSARHGENTASSTVAQSRERVSMLQFLHGVNTPQYCIYFDGRKRWEPGRRSVGNRLPDCIVSYADKPQYEFLPLLRP
jgi:hypothetical protein